MSRAGILLASTRRRVEIADSRLPRSQKSSDVLLRYGRVSIAHVPRSRWGVYAAGNGPNGPRSLVGRTAWAHLVGPFQAPNITLSPRK